VGPTRFNLRAYAIWIEEGKVLLVEETYQGRHLVKFPGGGVKLGEGILDALKREWKEEIGTELKAWKHFYTTEFFQLSLFHPQDQVVSVYYLVKPVTRECHFAPSLTPRWVPLSQLQPTHLTLPIDQYVVTLLNRNS
jgi:ADP-ribose pyrophosphatase YjhB (NUDIX family)